MGPTALSTQLDPTWGISVQRTLKLHDQCLGLSTEYLTLCCWWAHQAERRSWTLCYSPGWRRRSDSTSRYVEGDASRKAVASFGKIATGRSWADASLKHWLVFYVFHKFRQGRGGSGNSSTILANFLFPSGHSYHIYPFTLSLIPMVAFLQFGVLVGRSDIGSLCNFSG